MRRTRGRIAPLALLALTACYTFAPVEPGSVGDGDRVRVHLTREGVLALPELEGGSGPEIGRAHV